MIDWAHIGGDFETADPSRVLINVRSQAALFEDLRQRFKRGQGFLVATLNLDHVVKLRQDDSFREAYAKHTHVTADGNPVVWFSRMAGQAVTLTPGCELIDPLCEIAAQEDIPVAFVGSTPQTLEKATLSLTARYPNLRIVAQISPEMGFDPTGETAKTAIEDLKTSGALLCFTALGAPKQEVFAAFAAQALPQTGFLSIGAGLDFIAGQQKRAPWIVRKLAVEWLWRLACSPRRLMGRYLKCITILPSLTKAAIRERNIEQSRVR